MSWAVPLPPPTGDEAADLAAFAVWEEAMERHHYPDRFGPDGVRLPVPRRFDYYLGIPQTAWLNRNDGVPKFVSAARLDMLVSRGERWPIVNTDSWAIDSGAYIALTNKNRDTPWWLHPETYASKILSFATDSGCPPDFVAPQDWPCEPAVRAVTGATVREHQQETLKNYLFLVDEWPWLPWIPILQGWEPGDYLDHERMYEDAGVDLASAHRVGVGSICRRGHLPEIVDVIEQFADRGYLLHGFGIKTTALPKIGHLLASADSMAWSFDARYTPVRLPDCTHPGTNCANCYRYATLWRERVLASLTSKEEPMTTTVDDFDIDKLLAGIAAGSPVPEPAAGRVRLPAGNKGDRHIRGTITVNTDLQGFKTDDIVPAWVCCDCGGVELTEYSLAINHGCCWNGERVQAPARTHCRGKRPAHGWNAHWTDAAAAAPTTKKRKEPTVKAATTERKIRFNSYKGARAVPGNEVKPGEKIRCPVSGCDRQATIRLGGKVGSHMMYGKSRCHLAFKTIPADVMVDVISRVTAPKAEQGDVFADLDSMLADIMGTTTTTTTPASEPAEPSRSALPMIYDGNIVWQRREYPAARIVKRVDELEAHDVVGCDGPGIPGMWLYTKPKLIEDGSKSDKGDGQYVVSGSRDGERPLEEHVMWGNELVSVIPNGIRGWTPGHFDANQKDHAILTHDPEDMGLRIERVTWEGLYVKGRKQPVAYSDVVARCRHQGRLNMPSECHLTRAMEDGKNWYGWEAEPHQFHPTFVGSLRCTRCCGSIRSPKHTGVLNVDFDDFENLRMDLLHPGQTNAGRLSTAEHLDRYVRGVPLIRKNRDLGTQWTFVCPHPSCGDQSGSLKVGFATLRGLRDGWFKHCDAHHGGLEWRPAYPANANLGYRQWTGTWPDDEYPITEREIEFTVPAPTKNGPRQSAHVEVYEPRDDLAWEALVARFRAEGRGMKVDTNRLGAKRTINFPEGPAAGQALKKALVKAGIPDRDVTVTKVPLVGYDRLDKALCTVWPITEFDRATAKLKHPEKSPVTLDPQAINQLRGMRAEPGHPGKVKAVIVNTFDGRSVVVGQFDSVQAADKWWDMDGNPAPEQGLFVPVPLAAYDEPHPFKTGPLASCAVKGCSKPPYAHEGREIPAAEPAPAEPEFDMDRFVQEMLDIDAFLTDMLGDGGEPEPERVDVDPQVQREEARKVLARWQTGDPTALLFWAVGALRLDHAYWLNANWHNGQMAVMPKGSLGMTMGHGSERRLVMDSRGWVLLDDSNLLGKKDAKPIQVREGGWDQVLGLLNRRDTTVRPGLAAGLVERVEAAHAARERLTPGIVGASWTRLSGAGVDPVWTAAEQEMHAAAAQVWADRRRTIG